MRIEEIWLDVCAYNVCVCYDGNRVMRTVIYPLETDISLIKADIIASRSNNQSVEILSIDILTEAWLKKE